MALSVLLIDDHPLMRGAIRNQLETLSDSTRIEQAASLSEACLMLAAGDRRDLVLLDLNLPDSGGLQGLQVLRERFPKVPVMVFSEVLERATMVRCLEAGAVGYLPKTATGERLAGALRRVLDGGIHVPPEARGDDARPWAAHLPPRRPAAGDPRQLGLTDRQSDVLRLILEGLPNKLICRRLSLAEGTVKVHVSAVLRALGARNRTQAVLAASRLGLRMRP